MARASPGVLVHPRMQLGCWRCPSGCGILEGSLWQEGGSEELWGAHGEEGEGSGDFPSGEFPLVDLKLFSLEKKHQTLDF